MGIYSLGIMLHVIQLEIKTYDNIIFSNDTNNTFLRKRLKKISLSIFCYSQGMRLISPYLILDPLSKKDEADYKKIITTCWEKCTCSTKNVS